MGRARLDDLRRSRELDARLRVKLGLPPIAQTRYEPEPDTFVNDGVRKKHLENHWDRKTRSKPR